MARKLVDILQPLLLPKRRQNWSLPKRQMARKRVDILQPLLLPKITQNGKKASGHTTTPPTPKKKAKLVTPQKTSRFSLSSLPF
ncbi:hypothetical protein F383_21152 [Gossypium arboreum]|uniref:Uncharacterized protein n=1 Tax=Gossypium arboreum TaxID=29729 RepID=A0A0B0NMI7_GOSAR|nr:hypothetical protein F383_21152 [Gossypium arboreum]